MAHLIATTLAGVSRAAARDAAEEVRARRRIFSHGNAPLVSQDVQIQQVVGQISALAYVAESAAIRAAEPAQRAYEARFGGDAAAERQANIDAEIDSAKAQVVVAELALRASTDLFNALGASAAVADKQLDRHWRNARVHTLHDPVRWKYFHIGNYALNQVNPPRHPWN